MQCYYLSISAHQRAHETNVLFKLKPPLETNISFVRGIAVETVDHMCEEREGRKQNRGAVGGEVRGGGRGRCGEAVASVHSQTGCFGILSLAWQEYWIWQTSLCIHKDTKKRSHMHGYTPTNTYTQPSRLPPAPPCIDPAGLSLCGHSSFWTTG